MFRIFGQGKWNAAVSIAFLKKYGVDIIELGRVTAGPLLTSAICRKVANEPFFFANAELAGEQIARILEQANSIPVNDLIRQAQLKLLLENKWDGEFGIEVPYRDPRYGPGFSFSDCEPPRPVAPVGGEPVDIPAFPAHSLG